MINLEDDIDFIRKAVLIASFDSMHPSWILENTVAVLNPILGYPEYIEVWNQYGNNWKPHKQSKLYVVKGVEYLRYTNGSNSDIHLNTATLELSSSYLKIPLSYKKITREEYVNFYRCMAEFVLVNKPK